MQIDSAFQGGSIQGTNASEDRGAVADSPGLVPSVVQNAGSQGSDPVGVTLFNRQMSLMTEASPKISFAQYCSELLENYPDEDGDTVIHIAAAKNDLNLATSWRKVFPGKFAEQLNEQNLLGQTPLHLAVVIKEPEMIEFLIENGASISQQEVRGRNPIHMACEYGDFSTLETLFYHIEQPRDILLTAINAEEFQGMNSLLYFLHCHNPVSESQFEIVELLLKSGADPNFMDGGSGKNIVHYIADQNNVALYNYLHEKYPDKIDWQAPRRDGGRVDLVGGKFVFTKPEEEE